MRELENVIERAVTLNQGGLMSVEDLPARIRDGLHWARRVRK